MLMMVGFIMMINVSFVKGTGTAGQQAVYTQRWDAHKNAVCCKRECQQFPERYDGNKYKIIDNKCYCSTINDPFGRDGTWEHSHDIHIQTCGCSKDHTNTIDMVCAGTYLAQNKPRSTFCEDIAEQLANQYYDHGLHTSGLKTKFYMDCLDTIAPGDCEKNELGECGKCRHHIDRDHSNAPWGGCCVDRYGEDFCVDYKETEKVSRKSSGGVFSSMFGQGSSLTAP